MKKTVIIGGGAAGLMAACAAAEKYGGRAVTVIEKNRRPGRKLMITGKGRCTGHAYFKCSGKRQVPFLGVFRFRHGRHNGIF